MPWQSFKLTLSYQPVQPVERNIPWLYDQLVRFPELAPPRHVQLTLRVGPICEDPRQFVPASGQSWTTLAELQSSRTTSLLRDDEDSRITFIQTEPAFGINQTR